MNIVGEIEIEAPIEIVGGKARGLLKLKSLENKLNELWFGHRKTKVIIPSFFIIPPGLNLKEFYNEILNQAGKLNSGAYAVRSSSALEDIGEHSFDGIFETNLNVSRWNLIRTIYNVRKSATSEKAKAYAKEVDVELDCRMPVIVQAMSAPNPKAKDNYSKETGIIYSKFPCPKDIVKVIREDKFRDQNNKICQCKRVEAFLRQYSKGRVYIDSNQPIAISSEFDYYTYESGDLAEIALEIENNFGYPIIVEYSSFRDGFNNKEINLLQARKLTRLSEAEKFQMPELQEKGLIATTYDVNSSGEFTGEAFCIGDLCMFGLVNRDELDELDDFDERHKKEGYVFVTPYLRFYNSDLDRLSPNKRAVITHSKLGEHHDFEIARKKKLLYFNCNNCLHMGYYIAREERYEPPIKTGELVRVISDGEKGFVFNLSRD